MVPQWMDSIMRENMKRMPWINFIGDTKMDELYNVVFRKYVPWFDKAMERITRTGCTFDNFVKTEGEAGGRLVIRFSNWAKSSGSPIIDKKFWMDLAEKEGLYHNSNYYGIVIYDSGSPELRKIKKMVYGCGYKIGDLKKKRDAELLAQELRKSTPVWKYILKVIISKVPRYHPSQRVGQISVRPSN